MELDPQRYALAPAPASPKVPRSFVGLTVMVLLLLAGAGLLVWAWSVPRHWFELHVLRDYAFRYHEEEVAIAVIRWVAAVFGVVLVLSARRLGLRADRHPAGRVLSTCLTTVGAVYLALVVCEAIWRQHEIGERRHRLETRYEMADPTTGWKWQPSISAPVDIGGRTVTYAFDSLGNRAASKDAEPDLDRPTLLIAGESMSFGHGLEWDETFAARVGERLGMQVENLSCNGYGSDQAYLRLMDQLPRFKQPRAVITFFMLGQVKRNVYDTRPRLELAPDGALQLRKPRSGLAALLGLDVFRARYAPFHDDEAIDLTKAILRETDRQVRARGAFPLFVVQSWGAPGRSPEERPEEWVIKALFADQHLAYVVADTDESWRLPVDRHPDQRANEAFADVVFRALKAAGVDEPAPRRTSSAAFPRSPDTAAPR